MKIYDGKEFLRGLIKTARRSCNEHSKWFCGGHEHEVLHVYVRELHVSFNREYIDGELCISEQISHGAAVEMLEGCE